MYSLFQEVAAAMAATGICPNPDPSENAEGVSEHQSLRVEILRLLHIRPAYAAWADPTRQFSVGPWPSLQDPFNIRPIQLKQRSLIEHA